MNDTVDTINALFFFFVVPIDFIYNFNVSTCSGLYYL